MFLLFIIALVISCLVVVVHSSMQRKMLNRIEKEKLEPILDILYKKPESNANHQEFLKILRQIDQKFKKDKDFYYVAGNEIFEKLFRHIDKYPTDLLAHERFENIVTRAKHMSSEKVYKKLLEHIENEPTNLLAHDRFKLCAVRSKFLSVNLLPLLLRYLEKFYVEQEAQINFMCCVSQILLLSNSYRMLIYNKALEILACDAGNPIAKQLVLTIGRWYFGKLRSNGRPTVYDEQAILNDISVRSR